MARSGRRGDGKPAARLAAVSGSGPPPPAAAPSPEVPAPGGRWPAALLPASLGTGGAASAGGAVLLVQGPAPVVGASLLALGGLIFLGAGAVRLYTATLGHLERREARRLEHVERQYDRQCTHRERLVELNLDALVATQDTTRQRELIERVTATDLPAALTAVERSTPR
jgi:hypothetical protein